MPGPVSPARGRPGEASAVLTARGARWPQPRGAFATLVGPATPECRSPKQVPRGTALEPPRARARASPSLVFHVEPRAWPCGQSGCKAKARVKAQDKMKVNLSAKLDLGDFEGEDRAVPIRPRWTL